MKVTTAGRPGLVSVTFRQLSPEQIVQAAKDAGLEVLEWGGDVHVPVGDLKRAREVAALTRNEGLETICYGSYYKVGHEGEGGNPAFADVLETAVALGASCIRVWAGTRGSNEADEEYFRRVCNDANRIAGLAQTRGVRIAFEFHEGTLNDSATGAARLLGALPHPNIFSLWQPLASLGRAQQTLSLRAVLPRLQHLHVYHWLPGSPIDRRPLAEGAEAWREWMGIASESGRRYDALLEFVPGDDPAILPRESATLGNLLELQAEQNR